MPKKIEIDESLLINLYLTNGPISILEEKFHCNKSTIFKILKKHNIQKNKFRPEKINRENQIIEDYKNGMITKDILNKYQIKDPASLYCILNKRKVQKKFEEKRDMDFNLILNLYNEGKSTKEIGKRLNRSAHLIRMLFHDNNIKLRNSGYFKKENKDKIIELYNNGKNISEIARQIHCSGTEVKNILVENNILLRKTHLNNMAIIEKYDQKIVDLYTSGCGLKEISRFYKCSKELIKKILFKNNIKINDPPEHKDLDKQKESIIKLYNEKKSLVEIANQLDCSDTSIRQVLLKNNIELRKYMGENTAQWRGGIAPLQEVIRQSKNYRNWQINCFTKHNGKSEISSVGKNLQCHHIYPFKNILNSSLAKHKSLEINFKKLSLIYDTRFYDEDNGLIITEKEHKIIEKSSRDCHPYWKIWQAFPDFALKKFNFTDKQYLSFNKDGQLDAQDAKLYVSNTTDEIKRIIRYEHYLGTIPPHKIILTAQVNGIIAGIATFGQGANKNMPKDYWELTRLCVPYYVVRPFTIKFLNMCVDYIKENYPKIKQLISFADPNVGHDGAIYRMAGWKKEGYTNPSYCYFDPNINQLKHKSYCRRIKGIDKTELELAKERGLIKIDLLPKKKYSLSIV